MKEIFFGNFCARCGKFDSECEGYGKNCWDKIQAVKSGLKENGRKYITHKEFVRIIRNSPFCKPSKYFFSIIETSGARFSISDNFRL